MLIAESISVQIGRNRILNNVTACIRPGEILAVLGPNGAGKSTLLRTLSGELEPATGCVVMDGMPVTRATRREQALRRAVLPQSSPLGFPFRALEVAAMGRLPHLRRGVETRHDRAIARAAMRMSGVDHLVERRYPTLSGGEKQRVHLARVVTQIWERPACGNRYLLLDEPTAGLDPAHQHSVLNIARSLAAEGVGVFTVLHDLNLAAEYADRILLLKDGGSFAEGAPHETLTPQTIRDLYGVPAIVQAHPCHNRPLVILGGMPRTSPASPEQEHVGPALRSIHSSTMRTATQFINDRNNEG